MNNLIKQITEGQNTDSIVKYAIKRLYTEGPTSITVMEILSYLCLYCPDTFAIYQDDILKYMALFYKDVESSSLPASNYGMYAKNIETRYKHKYTPVQASVIEGIKSNGCFSFSAPTRTGKSYVFLQLITASEHDVIIVVPSRALINEYYIKITSSISDKTVNVLTFIDRINTKHANRNIFIVTPERCTELFKHKDSFDIEYFMFDEAQLSDEESKRALLFDSVVRRSMSAYPSAKFVFAHPFVKNPEAQIIKNHFDLSESGAIQYQEKSIGQMFLCKEGDTFYHFGIEKEIMGQRRIMCQFDPIEKAIRSGGSVLIYVSKTSIYRKSILTEFNKYIDICPEIKSKKAVELISQIMEYTGGNYSNQQYFYSQMLDLMRHGIVIHHGSLPLRARLLIEEFTNAGFCRICFATSTLEQGINMPFEVVYLHKFEASRQLALKNLIGRAGRSTSERKFDFGYVIVRGNCMSSFRHIMISDEIIEEVSSLENDEQHDDDYNSFKEAILTGTISDEYNLPEKDVNRLSNTDCSALAKSVIEAMFVGNELIPLQEVNQDLDNKLALFDAFARLYLNYLDRELVRGERAVLDTAIRIMIWRIYCKTFKDICWNRYAYTSHLKRRREIEQDIKQTTGLQKYFLNAQLNNMSAAFCAEYNDLPNRDLQLYSMFSQDGVVVKAKDVDYDRIVFDTYDYIDKLLGFKLSDVFYTAFHKYYEKEGDIRAEKISKYIKYGTDDSTEIWLLRYGLSFEDIEVLKPYIKSVDEKELVVDKRVLMLQPSQIAPIIRFINT